MIAPHDWPLSKNKATYPVTEVDNCHCVTLYYLFPFEIKLNG